MRGGNVLMCECESRYPHNGKCFNEYSTKIAAVYG